MSFHRHHRLLIVAGCVLANIVLVALAVFFLIQSRGQYEQRAEARSRTLALAIDQSVTDSVRRIDLGLAAVADELERQLAAGRLDGAAVGRLLARHEGRLAEVEGIRVTDAEGRVIAGKYAEREPVSLADRSYFRALKIQAGGGLQMSEPVMGRVSRQWVMVFARRYVGPDGGFGGIVLASVPLAQFRASFAAFDPGSRGIIGLRTADLGLVARHTQLAAAAGEAPGSRAVSAEMRQALAMAAPETTYRSIVPLDGLERVTTLRRLEVAPLVVSAGVASADYLGNWYVELQRAALMLAVFAACSAGLAFLLLRSVREALVAQGRNRLFLESASDGITILDEGGNVVEANRQFADMLGYTLEEILALNVTDWDAQWDAQTLLKEILPRNFAEERKLIFETRHRRKDGQVHDVEITVTFFRMDSRKLAYCAARDISERKRQKEALEEAALRLRESESRLQTIIEAEPECVKVLAPDGSITQMNRAGLDMIEAESLERVIGARAVDILKPEYRQPFLELCGKVLVGETGIMEFEITGLRGTQRWLETHMAPLRGGEGECTGILGVTRDITARKRAEESQRLAAAIFRSTREGIVLTDLQGTVLAVNPAYTEITGYGEAEVIGRSNRILKSSHHDEKFYAAMWRSIVETGSWQGEVWNRRKSGEVYPEWLTINTVFNDRGERTSYVGVFSDISRIKESEAEMEFLAHHDALTGLPNRLMLLSRIENAIARAERGGRQGAVLFIDLDRFKHVNDSLGHPVGDEVLCLVARRLRSRLREADTLARLGGDEFVALLEDLSSAQDAATVAENLIDQLRRAFELTCGHTVYLGGSIGISIFPADSRDATQLVQFADTALYQAKAAGRGVFRFYTASLGQQASQHLALEAALQRALVYDEFVLHYQPLMDMVAGTVAGGEALIRWQPPGEAPVSPDAFIPHAEETGLIVPLGGWVLRRACAQVSAWRRAGLRIDTLAVNVSPRQLRLPSLAEEVAAVLAANDLPPGVLELEITENAILELGEEAREHLAALKKIGVRLAIDDFGTGYSSLAYLKHFRVDKLKVDRSFVGDIPGSKADQEIAGTIIAMARSLGLEVLAEGVETAAQRDFLVTQGCRLAQGYFFSRPLPPAEIFALLPQAEEACAS